VNEEDDWSILNVKHKTLRFKNAHITIDRETGIAKIMAAEKKIDRILRRKKKTILLRVTHQTNIEADYPRIAIEGLTFETTSQKQLKAIVDAATSTRRKRRQLVQNTIQEAQETIHQLLELRAKKITELQNLKIEPRKTLRNASGETTSTDDPITEYQRQAAEEYTQAREKTASKIDELGRYFKEGTLQRIYAVVYAIEQIQDAKFQNDVRLFRQAVSRLQDDTCEKIDSERLLALEIPRLTIDLEENLDTIIQKLIDEA